MAKPVFHLQILPLGQCYITPGARDAFEKSGESPIKYLSLHASGDWGIVCEDDKRMNDEDVLNGNRVWSAYRLNTGIKIWVITEADRSATTILLPEQY